MHIWVAQAPSGCETRIRSSQIKTLKLIISQSRRCSPAQKTPSVRGQNLNPETDFHSAALVDEEEMQRGHNSMHLQSFVFSLHIGDLLLLIYN